MCNETENAQMNPVCGAPIDAAIAEQRKQDWLTKRQFDLARRRLEKPKSEILFRIADENVGLSGNIERLKNFLKNNPEQFASEKQIELMQKQLQAMENYKFFLSCRIADLALSDVDNSEEKKGA